MSLSPFVVRESAIHGKGAFASRSIQAGEQVGEYTGERITFDECERRLDAVGDQSDTLTYHYAVDTAWVIDGGVGGNDTRFINRSCSPNCRSVRRDGGIFFEALRDIAEGEELLLNYRLMSRTPASDETRAVERCYCGAPNCSGTLMREDTPAKTSAA